MIDSDRRDQFRYSVLFFLRFMVIGATFPMMSLWVEEVWQAKSKVGLFMGTIACVSILSQQFWGYMADMVWSRRRIMLFNIIVAMSLLGASRFITVYPIFIATWAMIAFLMTPINPMMNAMVMANPRLVDHYPRIRSWGTLGFIAASLTVGQLADARFGNAVAFPVACAGGFLAWAWVWSIRSPHRPPAQRISFLRVQRHFFTQRYFVWFLLALFLNRMAHGPMVLFQSFLVEDLVAPENRYSATLALYIVGAVAELPVFFFGRALLRRFGLLQMLMWSSGLAVLRFLVVPVVGYWGLLLTQLIHAATFGLYYLAGVAWINRHSPPEVKTSGQTVFNLVWFGVAPMVGNPVMGRLWDLVGDTHLTLIFHGGSLVILLSMMLLANAIKAEPGEPLERMAFPGETSVNQ